MRQILKTAVGRLAFVKHEETKLVARNRTAVFILSSAHSGSTWTGYVLGSGPESAFLGEYYRAWNDALRVPCTICAARGLPRCEVLYDIETEPAGRAFELAFARTGKRVIVDSSKVVDWIRLFQADRALDIRTVVLVRDPRGFFASVKRRTQADLAGTMAHWCQENRQFRDFIAMSGLPSRTASYDLLAEMPEAEFSRLFDFCGMTFTRDSLN